jgi:hypothetical protein
MFILHNEGATLAKGEDWAAFWLKVVALAASWGNRVHECWMPEPMHSTLVSIHTDRIFPDWYVANLPQEPKIDLAALKALLPPRAIIEADSKTDRVTVTLKVMMSLYEVAHLWEAALYKNPETGKVNVVDVCLLGDSEARPVTYSTGRPMKYDEKFVRAQLQDLVKGL